jgi:hypothetical protein
MLLFVSKKIKKTSLQGNTKKKNRACCLTSLNGSMTLESSLILPLFLIVLAAGMMYGQIFLIKGKMQHGLSESARRLATEIYEYEQHNRTLSTVYVRTLLKRYANIDDLPKVMQISAISLANSKLPNNQQEVELHLKYQIAISFPFFGTKKMQVQEQIYEKAFNGYEPTQFEKGNGYVYITQYGTVYHTSMECTHIMLTISDSSQVKKYINGKTSYQPCSKCAKNITGNETQLFIAKEGDCYHTSLNCSGLTRTIQKITVWEVGERKLCSRCGG